MADENPMVRDELLDLVDDLIEENPGMNIVEALAQAMEMLGINEADAMELVQEEEENPNEVAEDQRTVASEPNEQEESEEEEEEDHTAQQGSGRFRKW